jgi:hypothetical protein
MFLIYKDYITYLQIEYRLYSLYTLILETSSNNLSVLSFEVFVSSIAWTDLSAISFDFLAIFLENVVKFFDAQNNKGSCK